MIRIEEASITDLQRALACKELSSFELVQAYMERIAAHDRQGAGINAVLELNPDALFIAEAMDEERSRGTLRGPLHGIPILLKDNIDTADGMHTSAGSLALAGHYAREDAFLVLLLRLAGAVILGKTNMTEWANYMAKDMPGGYSSRGGQTLNPYGPGRFDAGGSSTGSGAAVAAGFAAAAVGTETSGSILDPAACNSVVGIKPTLGRISRRGVIPLSHSQDTPGPLARTVSDAALLLGAMCAVDPLDAATARSGGREQLNVSCLPLTGGLKGKRIGIPRRFYADSLPAEESKLFEEVVRELSGAGAIVVDPADIGSTEELESRNSSVFRHEFKAGLNAYLNRLPTGLPVRSLEELIAFNKANPEKMLKYGQYVLEKAEETSGYLTEPGYIRDRLSDIRLSRKEGIDKVMDEYRLDALLFPDSNGESIAAKASYPSIAVPAGYLSNGRPFGIMFTGRAFTEQVLIRIAHAFELLRPRRIPPVL
ncbi:amidase family protein [Paenibacillus ginsengarvi]|uniref:Amidase n=1 Tax=Paenibacillus ginsengarvi TaxID=400777 RepID=A0A3B0C0X0_9BACL|nr:amidase family protein [Paenibacillus ginsengarvi]RKN78960.1 amidase [Paenibacillus ginsengarvi]